MKRMKCTEFEILLADYLDGTLAAGQKALLESHRNGCSSCAELALNAAEAITFMERAATVNPPPELLNHILLAVGSPATRAAMQPSWRAAVQPAWMKRLLGRQAGFVLQPRFAMGMAMAVISVAMMGRFWDTAESGLERAWDRGVKGYQNLQLVYEVQTQLDEWAQERAPAGEVESGTDPAQNSQGAQKK